MAHELAMLCTWLVVGSMSGVCEWGSVPSVSPRNGTGEAQVSGFEVRSKKGFCLGVHHTPKPSSSPKPRDLQNLHPTCCLDGGLVVSPWQVPPSFLTDTRDQDPRRDPL